MAGGSSTPNSRLKTVDRYRKAVKLYRSPRLSCSEISRTCGVSPVSYTHLDETRIGVGITVDHAEVRSAVPGIRIRSVRGGGIVDTALILVRIPPFARFAGDRCV